MTRLSFLWLVLSFFGLALLVLVPLSISNEKSDGNPAFFFENSSPKLLSLRDNQLNESEIPIVTKSLEVLNRIFIDQYITWHRSILSSVLNGDLDGSTVKTLVYLGHNAGHGLGDRLRGLLLAYLCAVMSNRLFLIHWEAPFSLSKVFVNNMGSNFTYDESLFPSSTLTDGSPDMKRVRKATLEDLQFFVGKKGNHTKILFVCEPPLRLDSLFKAVEKFPDLPISLELKKVLPFKVPVKEEQFFPLIFKALFRPSAELRKKMIWTVSNHYHFAPWRLWRGAPHIDVSRPFISVHVRLGLGLGENNSRFERQMKGHTIESVAGCLARKAMTLADQQKISDPPRFYVACDTSEFRAQLKRALIQLNGHSKVMYGMWGVKHVRDMVERTKDDLRLLMYTFSDLYVLSRGKAILRGDSGFANLALWMGAIPEQTYYDIHTECEQIMEIPA